MVGQNDLLDVIDSQIRIGEFPRFSIIIGAEGSGKKTLCMEIAKRLDVPITFVEPKIDNIREMITDAYKIDIAMLYVISNGNMSEAAKNAMLKVCEETPKNAYIIMLVNNDTLDTLMSRACVYHMAPYTQDEIVEYASTVEGFKEAEIIKDLCETPGDVNKLCQYGDVMFYEFVEKVVDSIASVSVANALKIATHIDIKGDDKDKYDMLLFLKAFKAVCGKGLKDAVKDNDIESQMWYSAGITVVSDTLKQMNITGINKSALLDIFILNIRREWA